MNFTIVILTETCNDNPLTLCLEKSGNKYVVMLMNMAHEYTRKTFDTLLEAYKVFEKISSWMVFGYYSEADRRDYLKYGTMK